MSFVQVLVMGQGDVGQLGLGEDMVERKRPYPVKGLEGHQVVEVVCGGMHTAALTDKGKVGTYLSTTSLAWASGQVLLA